MPRDKIIKYKDKKGNTAQFILDKKIGAGVFGSVFLTYLGDCDPGLAEELPKVLACKKVSINFPEEFEDMKQREVKLSNWVNSSHNIKLYWAVKIERHVYLFFHFYNGGMLSDLVKEKVNIPEKLAAQILHQILLGLLELHEKNFVHRDLKPDNVLLHFPCMKPDKGIDSRFTSAWDQDVHNWYSVVIADLGMGREQGLRMTQGAGTPLYRAPECDGDLYDNRADILSVGIICYELLFGEPIFTQQRARNLAGLQELWKNTKSYTNERLISYEAQQFLQYSLQKDPNDRLYADELLELDFIKNAYNDEEYTMPPKDSEWKLYLTKHVQLFD